MTYTKTYQIYVCWNILFLVVIPKEISVNATLTFSENILKIRAGRFVNFSFLTDEYSKICPMQKTCGVAFDQELLSNDVIKYFPECSTCSCDPSCVSYGNCCPGTHYGYIKHKCINTLKFPPNSKLMKYFVSECIGGFSNETVIEKCADQFHPCISVGSKVTYSNKYCAKCNKETSCADWKLNVACGTVDSFEEFMSTIRSTEEFKMLLSKNKCLVKFEPPDNVPKIKVRSCNINDYMTHTKVDDCNITGLWKDYDRDIDWACKNFIIPYKEFKNVFCYICNPSRWSEDSDVVDFHPAPAQDEIEQKICQACEKYAGSQRLSPVKNVYCLKCIELQRQVLTTDDEMQLHHISETVQLNLSSNLSLKLGFTGKLSEERFLRFVEVNIRKEFSRVSNESPVYIYERKELKAQELGFITEEYTAICGNGNTCPETVSRNESELQYSFWNRVCGSCSCKNSCVDELTCCSDLIFRTQPYSCMLGRTFLAAEKNGNIGAVTTNHDNNSYTIIDRCINEEDDNNLECSDTNFNTDILNHIPVETNTNVTYRNIFCYKCNRQTNIADIRLEFQAICPTYIEHKLFLTVSQLFDVIRSHCNKLSFIPKNSMTCGHKYSARKAKSTGGFKFVRTNESHVFYREEKVYLEPNSSESKQYQREVFSQCNQTGMWSQTDDLVKDLCELDIYSMLYLPEYRPYNRVYKNFACFLCNPDNPDGQQGNIIDDCPSNLSSVWYAGNGSLEYLCSSKEEHVRWFPYKNLYCSECNQLPWQMVKVIAHTSIVAPAVPLKYIFSLSPEEFEHLDYIEEVEKFADCPGGTYDRILKQCQSLFCNDRYQLSNGTCLPIINSASYIQYNVNIFLHKSSSLITNTSKVLSPALKHLEEVCDDILESITNEFSADTDFFLMKKDCLALRNCRSLTGDKDDTFGSLYIDINDALEIKTRYEIMILFTNDVLSVESALVLSLARKYFIKAENGISNVTAVFESRSIEQTENVQFSSPCVLSGAYFDPQRLSRLQERGFSYPEVSVDRFLICPYVKLDTDNIWLSFNSSKITLKNRNVTFTAGEYQLKDGYVKICIQDFNNKTYRIPLRKVIPYTPVVKNALIIFSYSCTILSLVCLALAFLTYCILAQLRTVQGKNVMSLCVYLFFSQAFLQFGINQDKGEILCVVIGHCSHFFMLGSFCVMNVCSFHMFHVFWRNAFSAKDTIRYMFLRYLIYEIVVPFLCVSLTSTISLLRSNGQDFGYGKFYCFISDFYLFLFTFVLPVSLIFISNIIFFSLAFHKIRTSPNMNKKSTRQKNNYFICLKLFALIGITWPLMIVDNLTDIMWFSFVVSGLNSLQGVFIFVSFVINKNVLAMILSKLRDVEAAAVSSGSADERRKERNSSSSSK